MGAIAHTWRRLANFARALGQISPYFGKIDGRQPGSFQFLLSVPEALADHLMTLASLSVKYSQVAVIDYWYMAFIIMNK